MTRARSVPEPFGPSTSKRRRAGAVVLALGAVPLAVMAMAGARAYLFLPAIGGVATCAWLVDGRRYLGPGTVALGLGTGLVLARDLDLARYELPLVLGGIGAALTVIRFVDPPAVLGGAGLLVYAALSGAFLDRAPGPIQSGWGFVVILVIWAGIRLARADVPGGPATSPAARPGR